MTACEHHSCQMPANLSSSDLRLELRTNSQGRAYHAVLHGERFLGSIQDSGYWTWDRRWITRWVVIAGGQAVILGGVCDRRGVEQLWHPVLKRYVRGDESLVATLHAFAAWCSRTAFAWRIALH